jgi:hypothetical protein
MSVSFIRGLYLALERGRPDPTRASKIVPDFYVWDAATGALLRTIEGAGGELLATTVAEGGALAVTCHGSDTPRLIDLEAGTVMRELTGHTDIVQGLATTTLGDGPAAVPAGWDQTIRVFDLHSGATRAWDTGSRLNALGIADVAGRSVALVAGDRVGVWDLETGAHIRTVPVGWKAWKLATWPGDGNLVALLSFDGEVEVWDAAMAARVAGPMAVPRLRRGRSSRRRAGRWSSRRGARRSVCGGLTPASCGTARAPSHHRHLWPSRWRQPPAATARCPHRPAAPRGSTAYPHPVPATCLARLTVRCLLRPSRRARVLLVQS